MVCNLGSNAENPLENLTKISWFTFRDDGFGGLEAAWALLLGTMSWEIQIALMAENHCSKERKVFSLSSGKKNIITSWERQTSNQTTIIQCEKPLINMSVGSCGHSSRFTNQESEDFSRWWVCPALWIEQVDDRERIETQICQIRSLH